MLGVDVHGTTDPLESFFPNKVCINLARRSDRWVKVQQEFRRHGLGPIRRVEACDGSAMQLPDGWDYGAGSYGCLRSHYGVVSAARAEGLPHILIFEDDVEFHPDLKTLFPQYAAQIPSDWDAILFGGMHRAPPDPVAENIVRLNETSSTYAWAVRDTLYDAFLEINRETMIAVDENNHILQKTFRFYGFMPHLAWVMRDYSDIMDAEVNPWWLRHSVVLYGPEQERTLREMGVAVFFDSRPFRSRGEVEAEIEVLQATLRLYVAVVGASNICVVEHGGRSMLTPADLPENCHHRLLTSAASLLEGAGLAATALGSRRYFVCAPHYIYPLRSELRATLLCHHEYDVVTPLHQPLAVNHRDTQSILRDDPSAINTGLYPKLAADALASEFCVISQAALRQRLESRDGAGILAQTLLQQSRVFCSPSRILRLSRNSGSAAVSRN